CPGGRDPPHLRPARGAEPGHAEEQRLRGELRRAARARTPPHRRRGGQGHHAVPRSRPRPRHRVARPQLRGVRPLVLFGPGADLAQSLFPPRGDGQRPPRHAGDGAAPPLPPPHALLCEHAEGPRPPGELLTPRPPPPPPPSPPPPPGLFFW